MAPYQINYSKSPFGRQGATIRHILQKKNDSDGNRTRVTAVKGRCLNRLTTEPFRKITRMRSFILVKRRRRDLNPRAGFPTYTLSRGTSSANLSTSPACRNSRMLQRIDYSTKRILVCQFLFFRLFVFLCGRLIEVVSMAVRYDDRRKIFYFNLTDRLRAQILITNDLGSFDTL